MAEESFQDNFFDTERLKADLKGRSIRGGAVTMVAQGAKFFLGMGSTVVLARLLTPQDFGLIAMVTAVTGFVMMFKDMGLSMATVQKAEINHGQISTLFWINVGLSLCVMLVTAALAPVIAWFYGEPRLSWITLALAGAFIFGGLSIQHQALLRRQMRFGMLAIVEIVSISVSLAVGIIAACYKAGYWSLVMMQLALAIATAVGLWVTCGWRPGLPARGAGTRLMVNFGLNLTSFNIVNYFARKFDAILIGKFCGSSVLGLYSKAYQMMMFPINNIRAPLNSVAMPALSSMQKDIVNYRSYYSKLISLLAFISMPVTVFAFVCPKNIIRFLLGDNWVGASDIFRILAITAFIQPIASTRGLVLISLGQTRRYLKWGVANALFMVASFVCGLPWGAIGVASAYAVANYLILFPSLSYCFRASPISIATFVKAIRLPMIASLVMGCVIVLERFFLGDQTDIVLIGACLLLGGVAYFLAWLLMPGGIQILRDYSSYISILFRKTVISNS